MHTRNGVGGMQYKICGIKFSRQINYISSASHSGGHAQRDRAHTREVIHARSNYKIELKIRAITLVRVKGTLNQYRCYEQ